MAINTPPAAVVKGPNRIAGLNLVTPETARIIKSTADLNGKYNGAYKDLVHKPATDDVSGAQAAWEAHLAAEATVAEQYDTQDAIVADEAEGKLPGLKRRPKKEEHRKKWLREESSAAAQESRQAGFKAKVREMKLAGGLGGSSAEVANAPMTAEQNQQVRQDEVEASIADAIDAMPTDTEANAADLEALQKKYKAEIDEWADVL